MPLALQPLDGIKSWQGCKPRERVAPYSVLTETVARGMWASQDPPTETS